MRELKLFQINWDDVIIARTEKEALAWYNAEFCMEFDAETEAPEVKSYQKKHWWIYRGQKELEEIVGQLGPVKVGLFSGELAAYLTYAQSMKLYDYHGPIIFSSTEW